MIESIESDSLLGPPRLIADVLYLVAFYVFIERHGDWNFWSVICSALFPILWAPLRVYWLWFAPINKQPTWGLQRKK